MIYQLEPICALATASGVGAIAIIRVSGKDSIAIVNRIFKGKDLSKVPSHTLHFGTIRDNETIVDEVVLSIFHSPKSFTKEEIVEISCHGSDYIIRYILKLLLKNGCRMARPGEFTQRAFLNGQFDLVQAEAVADLIAADSEAAHRTALNQMRGGFSKKIAALREELIHFASMIELELDFAEEEVEFANRDDLKQLIQQINAHIRPLLESFDAGNVIKEGIPVAIIGPPNAGKSTLLNALLNEEKAIVTAIAGTTRDVIEDVMVIEGIKFRFIDTAGIRHTSDVVESIGIERSKKALDAAQVALMLYENEEGRNQMAEEFSEVLKDKKVIWVRNKCDLTRSDGRPQPALLRGEGEFSSQREEGISSSKEGAGGGEIRISAKEGIGIEQLKNILLEQVAFQTQATTVTNLRHYEGLLKTHQSLEEVLIGLDNNITGDFLAQDIRLALFHLGEITGTITTDDLLDNIFSKFCIGK